MNTESLRAMATLPQLDPGVTLLDAEERVTGALQSIVLDHILIGDGPAAWVDSHGNACTTHLAKIAPSKRTLERIDVARAFTPFQHYSLIEDLPTQVTRETCVIVIPEVDWFYGGDDLHRGEGEEMLEHVLDELATLSNNTGVPVLLTRHAPTGVGKLIDEIVDTEVTCELTSMGPRFTAPDYETLVYTESGYIQTTLAFWKRVLESRHPLELDTPITGVRIRGSN